MSLKIDVIPTANHKIKQRLLMTQGIIPHHPSVTILNGAQGSGKTNLLCNLLTKKQFYRGYFHMVMLFSNSEDDMYEHLIKKGILKRQHIKLNPVKEDIAKLIDFQQRIIEEKKGNLNKCPRVLVILDDIVSNTKLMNSREFKMLFTMPRHLGFSVILLSQYLNLIPKANRLQANHIIFFKGTPKENIILIEHYQPPDLCKKCFKNIIMAATTPRENDTHPFLMINRQKPVAKRFRRNLDITLTKKCDHLN